MYAHTCVTSSEDVTGYLPLVMNKREGQASPERQGELEKSKNQQAESFPQS